MSDDRWPDPEPEAEAKDPNTLTVAEAAEVLGWLPFKVFYHLELGRIPGARRRSGVWSIDRRLLLEAIEAGRL